MTYTKRIKSFLISLASLLGTALIAVTFTPEWAGLVSDAGNYLVQLGVPASLVTVFGLLVAEAWKAFLNKRTIANAKGIGAGVNTLDLY